MEAGNPPTPFTVLPPSENFSPLRVQVASRSPGQITETWVWSPQRPVRHSRYPPESGNVSA